MNKLVTLASLSAARRDLIVEASGWLVLAWIALRVLPFRQVVARLGDQVSPDEAAARIGRSGADRERALAQDIGWAVTRVAAHVPFRAVCLQRAVAAKMMLRRRGIRSVLYLGVANDSPRGGQLSAHAWVDAANTAVTDRPVATAFTELTCFM
jgi:hypothetical protein